MGHQCGEGGGLSMHATARTSSSLAIAPHAEQRASIFRSFAAAPAGPQPASPSSASSSGSSTSTSSCCCGLASRRVCARRGAVRRPDAPSPPRRAPHVPRWTEEAAAAACIPLRSLR
eukprot:358069-Chlamydomonas_euryale.AAC.3